MSIELKVPVLPESVSDATIASWHKQAGDAVKRDENLVDLETDKVVLEVPSPVDGVLKEIRHQVGDTVNSEQIIAIIEEGAVAAAPAPAPAAAAPAPAPAAPKTAAAALSPAAQRVATENKVDTSAIAGTGRDGRIIKEDVVNAGARPAAAPAAAPAAKPTPGARPEERVPMTRMRARIAERLMQSKNSIAMLTSFNEVNLGEVSKMRKTLGEAFQKEHGIKLGFMSFFVKAAAEALKRYPFVNASVDGNDVIYHGYQDISIAVSTDKGLVTPVLRDVQDMSFADVEKGIADYAVKARANKLSLDDLQGGTFTITNGGTFGSLLSTPIVNPPQSAILGMHTIKERPIVENGQIVAAPMMYIALSYDHRIIDGKDAVLFLVDIKNQLENPQRMLLGL
ncbi:MULTISPECIES: 2-oxoglutarate dehydrogenase complex dihydrolipoyllysine-residue succinyltransferase [Rhodanobacter]|uniref:Dihydrolipoyllysine-residue succinyltransferase component of 2-oxoglutarate dehydrogenase complex n=1 Tax=Rhodanobacter denitrificans TaxID=666685 RepID=M4ND70_9GAMM|nr:MULTISPECIES: 2-oxoglutarate dehydrogenase complex dihydrolipoyllysine-residue succinyltransferase [Rhodanobacter]AGG88639.1 2-oxoglutarate dehydrogenase complex dihydrolipoamide succinyltransferase [Rhodanobacter denitrificans]KZC21571.1 dihydrolipoamide succinyltransferase [Rhodanobacter denitrificans]UJJ52519.1 2-oxoglutarate dehydrogenase complex dihydrolipoyllysine-residue succinyltransferase [Rhodanobacter denitrificans]UJJ58695.1 2-oxoglutarate dehydrogenase complex dihydrolipoyllysin